MLVTDGHGTPLVLAGAGDQLARGSVGPLREKDNSRMNHHQ
eukprot:CAMPEP_0178535090 /NCGR_PEP_ID=MMETSP0696-20121128/35367_1 /TAXON_ID=265572 /ORGANISM="Extubocellulus spinifer, Strain CCMP396" /LENGTH=40 /DNA_ID= /DNA_START= /DNA_END= /DNA_ORIENTATION=